MPTYFLKLFKETMEVVRENQMEILNLIANGLVAIGTIAIAILAIWGDWFRSKFIPPKLSIQVHNFHGDLTSYAGGTPVLFYHLKVVNYRSWSPAKNCRVLLMAIYKREPDDSQFHRVNFNVPSQFFWAPFEITPPQITLAKEQILDFGKIEKTENKFKPCLYLIPNNFQGYVEAKSAIRYALNIVADNYNSDKYQVFEVSWNGQWSDNLDIMAQNLIIKEIKEEIFVG